MSHIESPAETFRKFASQGSWNNVSRDELVSDFFSISSETNLTWDQYYFEERSRQLFDPIRDRAVRGTGGADKVEEGINIQLENWFLTHESGIAVWISPRDRNRSYPEEKIIIHRIAYKLDGTKILLCSAHQFKKDFTNPEQIRQFIFTEEDNDEGILSIISWLTNISEKKVTQYVQDSAKRRQEASYFVNQYVSGVPIDRIIYEMTQTGFLGQNPIGCGSVLSTLLSNPNISYKSTMTPFFGYENTFGSFPCPRCHGPIPSGFGITTCPHCGLTKEQAGSTCG